MQLEYIHKIITVLLLKTGLCKLHTSYVMALPELILTNFRKLQIQIRKRIELVHFDCEILVQLLIYLLNPVIFIESQCKSHSLS